MPANQTTFSDTKNLIRGFEYTYEVKGNNTAGLSKASNRASTTPENKPPKPTALQASVASPTQVDLTWKGWRPPVPDGYYVYRGGTKIATVGAGNRTYTDTGLTTNQQYCYKVSAFNSAGETARSNQACVTVKITLPDPPSNLTITSRSTNRITIGWQDNTNNEKGFRIYRDGDGVTNEEEHAAGTNPAENNDSDEDGMPDDWERFYFGDLDAFPENDFDGDGISNMLEFQMETSPVEYVLDLKAGWNQFSLGTTPLDNSVETIFGDHPVRLPVWTWDGHTYRRVEELISDIGYWIYATEPARVEIRLISRDAPRAPLRILRR